MAENYQLNLYYTLNVDVPGGFIRSILKFLDFVDFILDRIGINLYPVTRVHVTKGKSDHRNLQLKIKCYFYRPQLGN